MIRLALLIPAMLATGCVQSAQNDDAANIPVRGAGNCSAKGLEDLVGRTATADLGTEALRRSGARSLRWMQPGKAYTMDYRADRLNGRLDADNVIASFHCG